MRFYKEHQTSKHSLTINNNFVAFDYFQHSQGDFCTVDSYIHEAGVPADLIPSFNSTVYGIVNLKNVIDFRPKVDTALTNKDSTFSGPYSPDIGSKNETDHLSHYWIPGRKSMKASFPIPRSGAKLDKMRDVLMCQTGYRYRTVMRRFDKLRIHFDMMFNVILIF